MYIYLNTKHVKTVVAALELDDLLAVGVGADKAEHAHARLRAGVREAHHLHRRHRVDYHLTARDTDSERKT